MGPDSAFRTIGELLGGVVAGDVRHLEVFFATEFPTLPAPVREAAFAWALSLDGEPSEADRETFSSLLRELDFTPRQGEAVGDAPPDDDRHSA